MTRATEPKQEKTYIETVTMQGPAMAVQASLNIHGFLAQGNVVLVGEPVARYVPSGDGREFSQERNLMNVVWYCLQLPIMSSFMSQETCKEECIQCGPAFGADFSFLCS